MSQDVLESPQLTERQERILGLLVREYTNNAEPVSSKLLAEQYLSSISSATIRNELVVLEELGYVAAPHTSAGRIPTEAGYRYFVKRLLAESELTPEEETTIASELNQAQRSIDQWMQTAAVNLARTSYSAAVVTAPRAITTQFKHLELISTQGRLVLMVLVLHGGEIRQQMLTLAESLSQEALSAVARRLSALCEGQTADQIHARARSADNELDREILDLVADELEQSDNKQIVAYREGLTDLLPRILDSEGRQQALRLMEERGLLTAIFSELGNQHIGTVRVLIAGDGRWNEITHLSIVMSRYGVNGQASGTLGVVGPVRMRYGRAISAVRYVSDLMSNLLINAYGADGKSELPAGDRSG